MQTVRQLHVGCRLPASPVAAHNRTRAPTDVARPASLPTSHTSWFYLDQPHLAGVQGFYPSLWTNHIPAPIASLRPPLPPPIGLAPGRSGAVLAPPTLRCCNARMHTPTGPIPPLQAPPKGRNVVFRKKYIMVYIYIRLNNFFIYGPKYTKFFLTQRGRGGS